MTDPVAFLDQAGIDWDVQREVVLRAREMQNAERREEIKAMVDGIGIVVGNRVGEVIGRMFG